MDFYNDERNLRVRCVELAALYSHNIKDQMEHAQIIYDFVSNQHEPATVEELAVVEEPVVGNTFGLPTIEEIRDALCNKQTISDLEYFKNKLLEGLKKPKGGE